MHTIAIIASIAACLLFALDVYFMMSVIKSYIKYRKDNVIQLPNGSVFDINTREWHTQAYLDHLRRK